MRTNDTSLRATSTSKYSVDEESAVMNSVFTVIRTLPFSIDNKVVVEQLDTTKNMKLTRPPSAFGMDRTHCLCKVLHPLLKMCKFYGLFPVEHNEGTCEMSHSWIALPALVNMMWLILITVASFVLYFHVSALLKVIVYGTDFYTFTIVYMTETCSTGIIFFVGNINAGDFAIGWSKLHRTVNEMGLPNFKKMKLIVYLIPTYLVMEFVGNFVVFLLSSAHATEFTTAQQDSLPFLLSFSAFITTFIPNLLSGTFIIILWIAKQHFEAITDRIQMTLKLCVLKQNASAHADHAANIVRLRLQHEQLIDALHYMERAFGLQMLAIISSTCVSLVAGCYALIIATHGLASAYVTQLSGVMGIAGVFAGLRLVMILVVSQSVMNKSSYPARVLNLFQAENPCEQVQIEVDKFLRKLGSFPLKISCCNIFPIGTCFMASASSNIITYILVLMQFKLDH